MDFLLLERHIETVNTASPVRGLRSCLISRNGQRYYEYYRTPSYASKPGRINSCTKSILSALICIAMDRGLLPEPQTPVSAFFPELAEAADTRKADITLEQLLTMTAGFNWTEFGGQNSFPRMTRSPHWVRFVLDQPMAHPPGARMEYSSGVSQLLAAILVQAAGMPVSQFAEEALFEPLGITEYEWESDPQGIHTGGYGLYLRPADMLKFGQLYLQRGQWEDKALISGELVAKSVQPSVRSEDHRLGHYGWHWWFDTYTAESTAAPALEFFFARGYGGQGIYVVPALGCVAVLTSDHPRKGQPKTDVFKEHIAPTLAEQLQAVISVSSS